MSSKSSSSSWHLGILLWQLLHRVAASNKNEHSFTAGNELCPCLPSENLATVAPEDINDETISYLGTNLTQLATYGLGCGQHDIDSAECSNPACQGDENVIPKSLKCDKSFCNLNFCYVDPKNCRLMQRHSLLFSNSYRFYSYATCWDVDSFTADRRISSLEGRIFSVGFNSNSGGWQGAYSQRREQFEGPIDLWKGPTLDFAVVGAERGHYQMNLTVPPDFLKERSHAYFNSKSIFDYCVYATSLGYLDFCLAQYTITDQRAATTDWLVLGSQDLHLIVQYQEASTGWSRFTEQLRTIFLPFTDEVWMFMIFFVIPLLGMLMIIHEYNHPGSSYPKSEAILVRDSSRPGSIEQVETRNVPLYRHLGRAVYINLLSVLQQNYVHSVVTHGAMLNLLGISFFILTIIAVYTANLAAILTQKAQQTTIGGLNDALNSNYRICSERKNLETVRALYPEIQDQVVAIDPVESGGDGLPGFNCPGCAARIRVFDFLDQDRAENDDRYCHAAFAPLEDLEVEQQMGRHCNKTIVGNRVGSTQTGIPVNELVSPELVSWFLSLKNDGVFDRELKTDKPDPQCPDFDIGGEEGESLNIAQLTGIWVVSFGFAAAGLLVTWLRPKIDERREKTIKAVHQYDQMGQRINVLQKDDDWIDEQSIMKGSKRVYVGDSRWSKATKMAGGGSKMSSAAFNFTSKRPGANRNLSLRGTLDDEDGNNDDDPFQEQKVEVHGRSSQPFSGFPLPLNSEKVSVVRSKSDGPLGLSRARFQKGDDRLCDFPSSRSADFVAPSRLRCLVEEASQELKSESSTDQEIVFDYDDADADADTNSNKDAECEVHLDGSVTEIPGEEKGGTLGRGPIKQDSTGLEGQLMPTQLRRRDIANLTEGP